MSYKYIFLFHTNIFFNFMGKELKLEKQNSDDIFLKIPVVCLTKSNL